MTRQLTLATVTNMEASRIEGGYFTPDQDPDAYPWRIKIVANTGWLSTLSFTNVTVATKGSSLGHTLEPDLGGEVCPIC